MNAMHLLLPLALDPALPFTHHAKKIDIACFQIHTLYFPWLGSFKKRAGFEEVHSFLLVAEKDRTAD